MSLDIQKLNDRHFKIIDLLLAGHTKNDIAQKLGMGVAYISTITNSPQFQHELALRRSRLEDVKNEKLAERRIDPVTETLKKGALRAAERLVNNIESHSENVAHRAATEILDRTGYQKHEAVDVTSKSVSINISAKDAQVIQETLRMLS